MTYEPKSYIPHPILIINEQISANEEDKTFIECMKRAFNWANEMGLKGNKVFNLHLEKPKPEHGPFSQQYILWCQIECTLEERKNWDENRKLDIEHAIYDSFR